MRRILVTCGETSGDEHAARLVAAIRRREPGTQVTALGGGELAAAGADVRFDIDAYSCMGFAEIVRKLPRVLSLERRLARMLRGGRFDLFVPVDYPGLNLRLARAARRAGVPVLYFISPQVWAWAGWRTGGMKRRVDLMAVIFPFEAAYYRRAGIPVFFAGHPLVERIPPRSGPKEAPAAGDAFEVVLFPGSRGQEVERHAGPMLRAAEILHRRYPRARFLIGKAPLIGEHELRIPEAMRGYAAVTEAGVAALGRAALVISASGTATLQTALSGTPMVVVYRTSLPTYLAARTLITIPWIAMPNVLAGSALVPELIQGRASPALIAAAGEGLLEDAPRYRSVSQRLLALRPVLERKDGLETLARIALAMARGEKAHRLVDKYEHAPSQTHSNG